jgi:MoaA/NifB/PqqE/SkfB family radical SAM enzyme
MPTLKHQALLLRGLLDGEQAYVGPAYIGLGISGRCNLNCLGCQYHSSQARYPDLQSWPGGFIPLPLAERIAQEVAQSGTRLVLAAGTGEPLLHPQWFEVLSPFRRAGMEVKLTTNGTLIDAEAAERLVDLDLQSVSVSTWAITADTFAKLCPGVDVRMLQRKLDGIRLLAEAKRRRGTSRPKLIFKSTINRHIYPHLKDMMRLAHELGCDGVAFGAYQDWAGEFETAALTDEQSAGLIPELARLARLAESYSLGSNSRNMSARHRLGPTEYASRPCYLGWFYANFRFDGTVNPCPQCLETVGDLSEDSFEQIWNGPKYRGFRRAALRIGGPASPNSGCVCEWCCQWRNNRLVHRRLRWLAPFLGHTKRTDREV